MAGNLPRCVHVAPVSDPLIDLYSDNSHAPPPSSCACFGVHAYRLQDRTSRLEGGHTRLDAWQTCAFRMLPYDNIFHGGEWLAEYESTSTKVIEFVDDEPVL